MKVAYGIFAAVALIMAAAASSAHEWVAAAFLFGFAVGCLWRMERAGSRENQLPTEDR